MGLFANITIFNTISATKLIPIPTLTFISLSLDHTIPTNLIFAPSTWFFTTVAIGLLTEFTFEIWFNVHICAMALLSVLALFSRCIISRFLSTKLPLTQIKQRLITLSNKLSICKIKHWPFLWLCYFLRSVILFICIGDKHIIFLMCNWPIYIWYFSLDLNQLLVMVITSGTYPWSIQFRWTFLTVVL